MEYQSRYNTYPAALIPTYIGTRGLSRRQTKTDYWFNKNSCEFPTPPNKTKKGLTHTKKPAQE